jgi:daunorubicin resistance ABC transporter ATP-binding subunit
VAHIVEVEDLSRSFGETRALDGVSFTVEAGTVLGLLGPNGAGKTTTVRVLATLLAPDGGRATVDGHDVVADADAVRSAIGLTGQYAAVDEKLTGHENLWMVGRLLGMDRRAASARADELLARFRLSDAGAREVRTYSGGMRRRVDLAVSLVGRPRVLFLDEPTTGLDPVSRMEMWDVTRELVQDGTTVLLTTQYLEEADELADRIVVIDAGRVIAEGTADELKDRTGARTLEVELNQPGSLERAAAIVASIRTSAAVRTDADACLLSVTVDDDTALAAEVIAALSSADLAVEDFRLARPSLDDVFLALTGHTTGEVAEPEPAAGGRRFRGPLPGGADELLPHDTGADRPAGERP